jgi:hypothetical protein
VPHTIGQNALASRESVPPELGELTRLVAGRVGPMMDRAAYKESSRTAFNVHIPSRQPQMLYHVTVAVGQKMWTGPLARRDDLRRSGTPS